MARTIASLAFSVISSNDLFDVNCATSRDWSRKSYDHSVLRM